MYSELLGYNIPNKYTEERGVRMLKFETYFDMDTTNMTDVKEFIFRGDLYKSIPHCPPSSDSVNQMLETFSNKETAKSIKNFIALDNSRYTGEELAFHCDDKQETLYLYCEDGKMKNFWWDNEVALIDN